MRSHKSLAAEGYSRFYRLGMLSARRRWLVLGIWIVVFLAMGPFLGKLNARLSQGGFEVPGSQSDQVKLAIERDFKGQFTLTDLVVVHSDTLTAQDPAIRSLVEKLRTNLSTAPGVAQVVDPYSAPQRFISADGRTITAVVGLSDTQDLALKHSPTLEKIVHDTAAGAPATAMITGAAPFYKAFERTTTHDLERAEKFALPISLVILVLAFGSLIAAGVPLLLALIGLAVSFGIISIVAGATLVSSFAQNIASMIGIGVGIDYSLFILTRYREELRRGRPKAEAIAQSIATSGKAVLVSALTVVVALSGILLVNIAALRSMGFSAMIAVAVAGTAALTLLPAFLSVIGTRVNSLRVRKQRDASAGIWHRWATGVMRRPWIAMIGSLSVLTVLALPVGSLTLGSSGPSILPADAEPRVAIETVAQAFGEGQAAPVQVVVTDRRGILGPGFEDVYKLTASIAQDREVARVDSIAALMPGATLEQARAAASSPQAKAYVDTVLAANGTSTLISVVTKHGPQSDEVHRFVTNLRDRLPAVVSQATAAVGGDPGLDVDINDEVGRKLIPVVGLVMVLSFFVLLLFFRSVLLPLKAIMMNLASVLATYGVLVFVFQKGHFEELLGFKAAGHIESFLPLFLFCILFGLSMDYEVFLLARVREEYLKTNDNTEAVGWGLEHTAGIITSAALIMVTVFGAFASASLIPIKAMGFGLALAVFLDASLIRVILVPATMRLMGVWNWWLPSWLDRLLPRVSLEEAPTYVQEVAEPVAR